MLRADICNQRRWIGLETIEGKPFLSALSFGQRGMWHGEIWHIVFKLHYECALCTILTAHLFDVPVIDNVSVVDDHDARADFLNIGHIVRGEQDGHLAITIDLLDERTH